MLRVASRRLLRMTIGHRTVVSWWWSRCRSQSQTVSRGTDVSWGRSCPQSACQRGWRSAVTAGRSLRAREVIMAGYPVYRRRILGTDIGCYGERTSSRAQQPDIRCRLCARVRLMDWSGCMRQIFRLWALPESTWRVERLAAPMTRTLAGRQRALPTRPANRRRKAPGMCI